MFSYQLFGLCVRSTVCLPGLTEQEGEPDVEIHEVTQEAWTKKHLQVVSELGGPWIAAQFYNSLFYLAEGGKRIWFWRKPEMPEDMVEQCLIGQPMAVVLRQRGHLVLHACSVARDGIALGFIGAGGSGKSTLAETYRQRGYEVLGDDVMAIRFSADGPIALPAAPFIRIREGTGLAMVSEYETLSPTWSASDQRMRTLDGERSEARVARLYLIDDVDHPATDVLPVPEQEAVLGLFRQTWAFNAFTAPTYAAAHLNQLADLVRGGFVRRLNRRRGFDVIDQILEAVDEDIGW